MVAAEIVVGGAALAGMYLLSKSKGDGDGWSGGGGSNGEERPEEFKKEVVASGDPEYVFNFPDMPDRSAGKEGMNISDIDEWFNDRFETVTPGKKKSKVLRVQEATGIYGPKKDVGMVSRRDTQKAFDYGYNPRLNQLFTGGAGHKAWRQKYNQVAPSRGQSVGIIYNPKKGYRRS